MSGFKVKNPNSNDGQLPVKKYKPKSLDIVDKLQDVQIALNDGLSTIAHEVQKLRIKSHLSQIPLNQQEMRVLIDSVKTLLQTEKQQMEAAKDEADLKNLSEMSQEEIESHLIDIANKLKSAKREVKPLSREKPASDKP